MTFDPNFESTPYVTFFLVSISPTFYARLFRTKVLREAFLYWNWRFLLFWRKNIGAKAARNILVKLTPRVFIFDIFWEDIINGHVGVLFLHFILESIPMFSTYYTLMHFNEFFTLTMLLFFCYNWVQTHNTHTHTHIFTLTIVFLILQLSTN